MKHERIEQGYLAFAKGMTTRIRRSSCEGKDDKWVLTFKQKVGSRVIEVEKKLDERDGADLWSVCVGKLKKDRYTFLHDGLMWELDLFKHHDGLYFILVEVEVNEGSERPSIMPEWLRPFVRYEVPLTDDRFSNKRLGDHQFARTLYAELEAVTP